MLKELEEPPANAVRFQMIILVENISSHKEYR